MTDTEITVIVPLFRQPNFLAMSLYGLVKNSVTRPRILVVWSRREAFPETPAWEGKHDFVVTSERELRRPYASVQEWISCHGEWATAHNIAFYEATEEGRKLRGQLGPMYIDGTDSAYKINIGIAAANTEYIVPNYDADFFPSPGWDAELLACMKRHDKPRHTWIPTHVQPRYYPLSPWDDIELSRDVACTHLTWPIADPSHIIAEAQWEGLCRSLSSDREIIEPCGQRQTAHWNPQAFRLQEFREHIKAFPWGTGTDMEVDNIAGRAGFTKVSTYRSFILHKGWIAMPREPFRV